MTTKSAKKLVLAIAGFAAFTALSIVFADGGPTASPSPYHTPIDTGINLDTSLVIGAVVYGAGVLFTSGAKVLGAKAATARLA